MRVLLVEDEVRLADNLAAALRDGPGFAVDWAEDGQAGDDCAGNRCYDLIVLDLMLPKLDGLSLLRRLRARKDSTPVLILTAKEGATPSSSCSTPARTTTWPSPSTWASSSPAPRPSSAAARARLTPPSPRSAGGEHPGANRPPQRHPG